MKNSCNLMMLTIISYCFKMKFDAISDMLKPKYSEAEINPLNQIIWLVARTWIKQNKGINFCDLWRRKTMTDLWQKNPDLKEWTWIEMTF